VKEAHTRHLEFLVFFAGILALIISSVQLANRLTFREAVETIGILGGVLMACFAGLGLLIRDRITRSVVVFCLGVALCVVALFAGRFL
jgi:uncharacterized membrane protein